MYLPKVHIIALLYPFSWLYGLGVWVRNKLFDMGRKPSVSFEDQVAVICVGNLAVGGTGKTPHTEYLIGLLKAHGIGPIAVLSRGYKRQSRGFVLATPDITATQLGDESFQLYHKMPDVIVAVDERRPHGIRQLLALPTPPRVILLDDAMQHRYVKPGLTICLTSYGRILYKDALLPAGLLREPMHGVRRADMVVVTKCPSALRSEEETEIVGRMPTRLNQPIFYSAFRYSSLVNLASGQPCQIDHATEVLIVSGIADPRTLQQYVQAHYRLLDVMTYSDHHRFTGKDIASIRQRLDTINEMGYCTNASGKKAIIITTEKDAARLVSHPAVDDELRRRIYCLPTEVYFLEGHQERFDQMVLDYVSRPRGGQPSEAQA